jgi:hypothetical protein
MKLIAAAFALTVVLLSAPAHAQAGAGQACRAALHAKAPCRTTRLNTPARTACFKAAMERCKRDGPGAI